MATSSGSAQRAVVLESMFGPLGAQPFAPQIYNLYTGFVYLTPLFGGWLADHVLGQRRTVILGAGLMAVGHFMMAFEPCSCWRSSRSSSAMAPPSPISRPRSAASSASALMSGAFLAPLCGTLGEKLGWHYGFAAAGVASGTLA